MEQTKILEKIEELKQQQKAVADEANQAIAYLRGQIDLLTSMLDKDEETEDDAQ